MSENALNPNSTLSEAAKGESPQRHIENRRLFDAASGRLKLEDWEYEHVRQCRICEGVLCVMVFQTTNTSPESADASEDGTRPAA